MFNIGFDFWEHEDIKFIFCWKIGISLYILVGLQHPFKTSNKHVPTQTNRNSRKMVLVFLGLQTVVNVSLNKTYVYWGFISHIQSLSGLKLRFVCNIVTYSKRWVVRCVPLFARSYNTHSQKPKSSGHLSFLKANLITLSTTEMRLGIVGELNYKSQKQTRPTKSVMHKDT